MSFWFALVLACSPVDGAAGPGSGAVDEVARETPKNGAKSHMGGVAAPFGFGTIELVYVEGELRMFAFDQGGLPKAPETDAKLIYTPASGTEAKLVFRTVGDHWAVRAEPMGNHGTATVSMSQGGRGHQATVAW
jgi:hypothetical protein